MSSNITRLPALSPRQEFGGRSPNGGGPGSPLAQANGNADMEAVMEDAGLRAENSDLGPRLAQPPRDPLPPRAESTPPDRDLPERKGMGIDVPAWPSGNKRGARGGGSGMWAIHEGAPSQLKSHSPFLIDTQRDSARSYLWAHRSAAHATFKGRAAAGDGNLLPSASGKRLDDRLSRNNSPIPGATAWGGAPGGVGEQEGAPLEWKELQHAAAMASAQMMHEAPNAALTQIEIAPGQKGSLSPEHLKQMHGMSETDIQRLYRAMRIYTLGFHEMMQDICSTAADRRGLLVKVWRLFGRLWDSSLQVVFDSEVLALGADRERALQQVTFLQRELGVVKDENMLIRSKVNEMVNHALTRSHQDQASMENTSVLQSELNRAKQLQEESALQREQDARKIKQLEDEMHRMKKDLYKAEAQVKAKADELSIVQVSLSTARHSDDEIRRQLKSEEARANRAEEAAAEAAASRAAMYEEKEMAVKTANVARHDMFEERRAKRILQVDVEYVRGEIIERREEAKELASQIKAYADAKQEAEDHLRHVIAWRQRETDRAETYERDIQALVVMFNHMQDEVDLNFALKQEVQKYKSLLEEKRAKKRTWKERCTDARKIIAAMKEESAEADAIRDAELKRHAQEVENLVRDVQLLEATNAELHDRLKPLRVEVADMKQRMTQLQLARTSAKMRLEAANKRTAKLVDALSENIRILAEERDKAHRLGQELKAEREITEMQRADMAFLKEEHVAEVAKLRGEIKKAENQGNQIESQLEFVRQQAMETGSDLSQQIQELNEGLMDSQRERDAAEEHLALKQHHLEVAHKKIEELEGEIQEGKTQIKEAYTLKIELDYSKKACEKYKGWLQATNIGVKGMMQEFKDFLEKEPSAPVGDDRAWNGIAEGTLGSAMGNEYETEALVVDLDNNWDFLLQEKTRLVGVLNGIKTDRDGLKDELNEFLVQREDKEMDMQNTVGKIRKDMEVLNLENVKIREHSTSLTVKISNLTNEKAELEEKLSAQAEQLRGTEAEVAALKALQERSEKLDHVSEELQKSETQRKLLIDEVEKAKQEAMQLASYEKKVEDLNETLQRRDVDIKEIKQLVQDRTAQVTQLEGEIANIKAKERDAEAVLAELTNVKAQLEEVNAALAAKEKELIKTQAAASESAGYIAEALRGELDALGASTTQKIEELTQQLKEKAEEASAVASRLSQLEAEGMTEEAREHMKRQHSLEKEHLVEMHKEETETLTASHRAEIDKLKEKLGSESASSADVVQLEEELEDLKEAKEAAYRNLVKADDEIADLQSQVFALERKLTAIEQTDAAPNAEDSKPGSPIKTKDEMSAEVRSVVERLAQATLKSSDQLVSSVWCSSMMQHADSETILTDMMWTAESLEKMISEIYCEKIEADLHDYKTGEPVQTMQEFVYDYFMQKTGIRAMGEVHLSRLIASIEASLKSSPRVHMFGALVGHPSCTDWPKSSETVFISVLSHIFSKAGGVPTTEATEGRSDIERTVIQDAAAAALPAMEWNNIEQKLIAAGGGGTVVDLDKAMGIVMDAWLEEKQAEEERAGAIFAQFEGTKDNLMQKSDFKKLMASIEGEGATAERIQEVFDKLLEKSVGMSNDCIPGPVFRAAAWPMGIAGGSGYCKVEHPAALTAPVAFPEGLIFLRDIVPTIGKVVDEICESLKDTKSVAEELGNMRKLFAMVTNAAASQASGNEVWNPYRRFILLLHISHSRKMVLLHESRAAQGVAGFNTKFGPSAK